MFNMLNFSTFVRVAFPSTFYYMMKATKHVNKLMISFYFYILRTCFSFEKSINFVVIKLTERKQIEKEKLKEKISVKKN